MLKFKLVLPQGFMIFSFPLLSVMVNIGSTIEFETALIFIVVVAVHPLPSVTVIFTVFTPLARVKTGFVVVVVPLISNS